MKEDLYDDLYVEEKEEKTDFKAILFKYAIHWPWFVACTPAVHSRSLALFTLHPAGVQHLGIRHHQGQ